MTAFGRLFARASGSFGSIAAYGDRPLLAGFSPFHSWLRSCKAVIRFKKISALYHRNDITTKKVRSMSLQCPRCHSPKVASFHHAMKIAAAVGTVGGAARGVSAAMAGGKAGAAIGAVAGPVGITIGSVSGAIFGGLVGGVGGCALGAQLGDKLDRHVLAHNLCLLCGHRFNLPT